jgi:hypothetical protein
MDELTRRLIASLYEEDDEKAKAEVDDCTRQMADQIRRDR